jgi:hypothetical protein
MQMGYIHMALFKSFRLDDRLAFDAFATANEEGSTVHQDSVMIIGDLPLKTSPFPCVMWNTCGTCLLPSR